MKKFIIYITSTLVLSLVIIVTLFLAITCLPYGKSTFDITYQSVIQRKYDKLISTNDKKIIIVSGSSGGFGIDEEQLREKTGYQVVNLGLHAGFGNSFPTELSKANINEGDIVLLCYEWGWHEKDYFNKMDATLVTTGVDNRIEMYKHLSFENKMRVLGNIFKLADKKQEYMKTKPTVRGVYFAESFNDEGRMIYKRDSILKYDDTRGYIDVENAVISEETIKYLTKYKAFVENSGASIYFISPPYYKAAVRCTDESIYSLKAQAEEKLGIKYISDPIKHSMPIEYFFDTIYHCNDVGEEYNTSLIIDAMLEAGII